MAHVKEHVTRKGKTVVDEIRFPPGMITLLFLHVAFLETIFWST